MASTLDPKVIFCTLGNALSKMINGGYKATKRELADLPAVELLGLFQSLEASPVEVLEACLERARLFEELNAFVSRSIAQARKAAKDAERAYVRGDPSGSLAGIPLAVKDIFDTRGITTAYGSRIFRDHVPAEDATAVRLALRAGAVPIGKTGMHEFAWGITNDNPHFGPTRNPWAPDRLSGGSSGGSAVAVATGQATLALGSDTGGSARIPAAFCGVVGFKPTYGMMSTAGMFPLARTLDHPALIARSPADIELIFQLLAGIDPRDPETRHILPATSAPVNATRVGVVCMTAGLEPEFPVVGALERVAETFVLLGADVRYVNLPDAVVAYETFRTIQGAEALFTHTTAGLYPTRAEDYGVDIRTRLEEATAITLADYLRATEARRQLKADLDRLFIDVDLLVSAASPFAPPLIGQNEITWRGKPTDLRSVLLPHTVIHNLTGIPSCSVRAGFDNLNLPVGVQISGPDGADLRVLKAAYAFYAASPEIQQHSPPIP